MNAVNLNSNCKVGVTLKRSGKYEDVELRMFVKKGQEYKSTSKAMQFGVRQLGGLIEALENIRTEVSKLPFDDIDIQNVTWISE